MPRSIWKGSIAFGLVSIPVELHTAVRDHRPKFRMLHARDTSQVRYERICQRDLAQSQHKTAATRARTAKRARPARAKSHGRKKASHAA